MKKIFLVMIFFFLKQTLLPENFLSSYYNKDFNQIENEPEYLYIYKFNNNKIQFSFLTSYKDKKENSLNFYFENYFRIFKYEIFCCNYYLNFLWNQIVFLKNDFSNDLGFFEKRIQKGIYSSFLFYDFPINIGLFYLEDHSKGIYFYNNHTLILGDFYNKKYAFYNNINTKLLNSIINIASENHHLYGYTSLKIKNQDSNLGFFIIRKPYWDQYDYYSDKYLEKQEKNRSFNTNINYQYSLLNLDINYFIKGNVSFLKNYGYIKFFNYKLLSIYSGLVYLEKNNENKYLTKELRYSLLLELDDGYKYFLELEESKNHFIIKFKIGLLKKQIFNWGIFYQNFNMNKIQNNFDFFNFSSYSLYTNNYLMDRTYTGLLLQTKMNFDDVLFYCYYIYQIRFIQSRRKELQQLEVKFSFKL